jgi:hypothetical protein
MASTVVQHWATFCSALLGLMLARKLRMAIT